MLRLRRYDFSLKGGYQYTQPETGMRFDGNTPFRPQVNAILRHRTGNSLRRATWEEVAADLEAYTCARMPGACYDSMLKANGAIARTAAPMRERQKCAGCGARRVRS